MFMLTRIHIYNRRSFFFFFFVVKKRTATILVVNGFEIWNPETKPQRQRSPFYVHDVTEGISTPRVQHLATGGKFFEYLKASKSSRKGQIHAQFPLFTVSVLV